MSSSFRAIAFSTVFGLVLWSGCGDDDGGPNNDNNNNTVGQDSGIVGCGNGRVEGTEECDNGEANSDSVPNACRTDCTPASCGDNVVDSNEECDNGPLNADLVPDACRTDCTLPYCGDGIPDVDHGEACDDGNTIDTDNCLSDCNLPHCGDGVLSPEETCDDGNNDDCDGCRGDCKDYEWGCGDGFVCGSEVCDDANGDPWDGCFQCAMAPVAAGPPPVVTSIDPPTTSSNTDLPAVLHGANFRNPTVTMECRDQFNMIPSSHTVGVTGSTSTTIDITVPIGTDMLFGEWICRFFVANSDQTSVYYTGLAITNAAANLAPWANSSPMLYSRRAPVGLSAQLKTGDRLVYAFGGDNGTASGAHDTGEVSFTGPLGELGPWATLPAPLPTPLTLAAGVRIGRFLYLVGGNSGAGPLGAGYRAEVLEPGDSPIIYDVTIATATSPGTGLAGGRWIYKVSAVYGSTHSQNPNGESLPSPPYELHLPSVPEGIKLTVRWTPVLDAVGYRVYRSPAANAAIDGEELLATVPGGITTAYIDQGGATVVPAEHPLPKGSLGNWITLPSLQIAREGLGLALCSLGSSSGNPDVSPGTYYLYAVGGHSGAAPEDTYEYLTITVSSPEQHTVGSAWQLGSELMSVGRWQLGVYGMGSWGNSQVSPGTCWIYVVGGLGSTGSPVSSAQAASVGSDGALSVWSTESGTARAGFGSAGVNDKLLVMAGAVSGGVLSPGSLESAICRQPIGCPDLSPFNNVNVTVNSARTLPGTAVAGVFIYLVGGSNDMGLATDQVELSFW